MPERKKMFSDSWHLVAERHASLKASVETGKQYFRGERWYVLRDPFRNEFFRVTEPTYNFLARLSPERTIEEVWRECMEKDPDEAPGQEEVIEILGQLNNANLIQSDIPANSSQLYQQFKKTQNRQRRMQAMNFLFFKIPIFNPDRMLEFLKPLGRFTINPFAFLVWLGTVMWALKIVFENFELATEQSSGFLSPQNIPYIFACTIILKAIHELAHGIACKHFGGPVTTFGVMLMVFAPLPYVDATSSWGFRNKSRRIAVAAAGMYAEVFVAALATFIWAETGRGAVNGVAYNVMVIASVTTVIFNINPLLKFDGYYIFSDLLDLPNLQQRSMRMIQFLFEYKAIGYKDSINPSRNNSEGVWLVVYGIASSIYRVFLMLSIAFLVADKFFEIGLLIAIFTTVVYVILPIGKYFKYVATNRNIYRKRQRAWAVTFGFIGVIVLLLGIIPFPDHFTQPGIVAAKSKSRIFAMADGRIERIVAPTGTFVEEGDVLIECVDPEMDFQIESLELAVKQMEVRFEMAQDIEQSSVGALREQMEVEKEKLMRLREVRDMLTLRAPQDGLWVAPDLQYMMGSWLPKGTELGSIINEDGFIFFAVVSQTEAVNVFQKKIRQGEVKIWGQTANPVPVRLTRIIQAEQSRLPSPSLGWMGGGQIEVDQEDPEGTKVVEPFFAVIGDIRDAGDISLYDEYTGRIRIRVGSRPLIQQWFLDARKVLQRRLKI